MSTNERPSVGEIREAVADSGLDLSNEDLERLAAGGEVSLEERHGGAGTRAADRCEGILIYRINQRCGVYLTLSPPQIKVCCNF